MPNPPFAFSCFQHEFLIVDYHLNFEEGMTIDTECDVVVVVGIGSDIVDVDGVVDCPAATATATAVAGVVVVEAGATTLANNTEILLTYFTVR